MRVCATVAATARSRSEWDSGWAEGNEFRPGEPVFTGAILEKCTPRRNATRMYNPAARETIPWHYICVAAGVSRDRVFHVGGNAMDRVYGVLGRLPHDHRVRRVVYPAGDVLPGNVPGAS